MKLTALTCGPINTFQTLALVCFIVLSACSEQPDEASQEAQSKITEKSAIEDQLQKAAPAGATNDVSNARKDNLVLRDFMAEVDQHYANLQAETEALYQQVITFSKAPSAAALENSIKAWEQAHNRYLAGSFLNQLFKELIKTETLDQPGPAIEARLDAHPLLPGYLDAVSGYPYSGLIHSDIPLTLANLYQEFQLGDPAYVTLGFHALEVMLKGTDQERELSEFAKIKAVQEKHETDPELRRTLYSNLLAEQIRQDVFQLPANWRQNIKVLLLNLDEPQSRGLKSRLLKSIREQSESMDVKTTENGPTQAQADEHFNEQATAMKLDLQNRILLSLESDPAT